MKQKRETLLKGYVQGLPTPLDQDILIGEVIRCFELGLDQRDGGLEEQDDSWIFWMRRLKSLYAKKQAKDIEDAQKPRDETEGPRATPPDQLQIDAALDQAESFLPPESDEAEED